MAFQGTNISPTYSADYSLIDAYRDTQQYNQIREKMATQQRTARRETIENEWRMGFIEKDVWYERRIVDLQRMYQEETDPIEILSIKNDILRLQDTKATWIENQIKKGESAANKIKAAHKEIVNSQFSQIKQQFKAEDYIMAEQLNMLESVQMTEEDKVVARYKLYNKYMEELEERKADENIVAKIKLDEGEGDTYTGLNYIASLDKKMQVLNGEGTVTVGMGDETQSITGVSFEKTIDQVRHLKGVKETDDGTFDFEGTKDDSGIEYYQTDGTYAQVYNAEDKKWEYVEKTNLDEDIKSGNFVPGEHPLGGQALYRKKEEEIYTMNELGETDVKGKYEYVEAVTELGVPVRLQIKGGQVDWGHLDGALTGYDEDGNEIREIPTDPLEKGAWALGYDSKDDIKDMKYKNIDGNKVKTKWFSDERLNAAAKEVDNSLLKIGAGPFENNVFRDSHSGEIYTIQNQQKVKIDDINTYLEDNQMKEQDLQIFDDTENILDNFTDTPQYLDPENLPTITDRTDIVPSPIKDDVYRFKKADGGFEFMETSSVGEKSITMEEYAQRKGVSHEEALTGSENEADQRRIQSRNEFMEQIDERFLNPTKDRISPYRYGFPKGRGLGGI